MSQVKVPRNRRVLIIDDSSNVHVDFQMILAPDGVPTARVEDLEMILFGEAPETSIRESFDLEFALQGEEGIAQVRESVARKAPYAVAFVDMRMPPGIDGLDTVSAMWEIDPNIQVVIATAYSDQSMDEIAAKLGRTDQLLILRKPFEPVEVRQAAAALSEKWRLRKETRQRLRRLESTVAALERSNGELRRLGYISAHHLQEPLRTLQLSCDLLYQECSGKLSDAAVPFMDSVREHAKRARLLVAGLLSYARVDVSGPPSEHVDLNRVLECVLEGLADALGKSGSSVKFNELPTVIGDEEQWRLVFRELIENSSVYCRDGGAHIEIEAVPVEYETGANAAISGWEISVRDDGIGVDQRHQESVFDLFERLHDHESYPGTGVGLAVCRRILERHGGRILMESARAEGEPGTVIRMVIPKIAESENNGEPSKEMKLR